MSELTASSTAAPSTSAAALAAVTAAADVNVKDSADLAPLMNDMFTKLSAYANGELAASSEEYELLEKLNRHAAKKYENMADHAIKLVSALTTVNATHQSLQVYFEQIDLLEKNLNDLEQVVEKLDVYSKRLHYTFQQVYAK